jgi:lysophospholipase L1-like esterase
VSGGDPFAVISRVISSDLVPDARARQLSCYVALGDSFTAGTGCAPGEAWADRLVAGLRIGHPGLAYRNLAVDGATSAATLGQLPEAIELEPDLVTVICGANDILGSTRPDTAAYARRLTGIVRRFREAVPGVRIVTATYPEGWEFLPLGPRTRARVERGVRRLNAVTRAIAERNGIACLEVAGHPGLSDPENFCADGLHPSPRGHAHTARAFARLLRERFAIETGPQGGEPR